LAEESLKTFGNLKDSLEYLYFANSNGYDGLNFLKDFPQFAKNYTEVLPAYSANSSLVKTVYDQFQRDPRISLDRNELFLKGLKEYQDLNLIKKNLMIQTVHAVNNLTLAYEQGLPRLDKDSVWLLTNATQISKDIADMDALPAKLEKDGIGVISLQWDSDLLRSSIPDKTNRTIALFYLADLPAKTMDKTTEQTVSGINGMKKFIQQLPKEYDEIVKTYKDPVLKGECIRRGFYGIFGDRRNSGLKNTIEGFTGHFTGTERIDEVLDKYWKKEWEIIKVVDGYEWLNFPSGDAETMAYGIPLASAR
jgi:hypothetical protein